MIRNSKCFTDIIAHIHKQLLRLLPKWETFSRSPQPTCSGQGAHSLGSGTSPSVGWLEMLVKVWTWKGIIPVILNDEIPST